MIIIDTCFWLKIRHLRESNVLDLIGLMYASDLWATHELKVELEKYLGDLLIILAFPSRTVKINPLEDYTEKELDAADLSIIEFGRKKCKRPDNL